MTVPIFLASVRADPLGWVISWPMAGWYHGQIIFEREK